MGAVPTSSTILFTVMKVLAIRHALAEAPSSESGLEGPPLSQEGMQQVLLCREGLKLAGVSLEEVAVSSFRRNRQTANLLGAKETILNPLLNEVELAFQISYIKAMIDDGEIPARITDSAERLLVDPPQQEVWIVHGWQAVGINYLLNNRLGNNRLLPFNCEPFEIEI